MSASPFLSSRCLCLITLLAVLRPVSAAPALTAEMAPVARDVAELVKDLGHKTITINPITGPPGTSAGPGLAKALADELARHGVRLAADALVKTRASYTLVDPRSRLAARITIAVLDRKDKVQGSFTHDIRFRPATPTPEADGAALLAPLLGVTGIFPADGNLKERLKAFGEGLATPRFHADETRILAARGSPYAIEIQVAGKARKPSDRKGRAFVEIGKNEQYAVRIINNSEREAAVTLSIDGLSMFAFSEKKSYTRVIVPARSSGLIKGWHRTNEKADAFRVGAYSDSAAAKLLPASRELGTITATFATAWPTDESPPADEAFARLTLNRGEKLATGRGPEVRTRFREIERHIGVVRASISVAYTRDE